MQKTNAELRANVAELETGRISQQQEREELARSIAELQSQVGRQSQDVAFYRGLVNTTLNAPTIKVQKFEVLPERDQWQVSPAHGAGSGGAPRQHRQRNG